MACASPPKAASEAVPSTSQAALAAAVPGLPAPGESLDLQLEAGAARTLTLALPSPTFLHLRLEQRGIDAALELHDPDGGLVATSRGAAGRWEEEELVAAPELDGHYRLVVRPEAAESGRGSVVLEVLDRRPAVSGDPRRLALEQSYAAALALPDPAARVTALEEAVAGFAEIGARERQARALARLGAARRLADPGEEGAAAAQRDLHGALALWAALGDAAGEAAILEELARQALGNRPEEARELLQRAAERARASGRPGAVAMVENTLGALAQKEKRLKEALQHWERAADGFLAAGDQRNYAITLINRGMTERRLGSGAATSGSSQAETGCLKVEEAMRLARELRFEDSALYVNYGLCQRARGRGDAAHAAYAAALDLAERDGDTTIRGMVLFHLGSLLAELGDFESGRRRLEEARELLHDQPGWRAAADTNLGWIAVLEERPEEGIESFRRALERAPDNRIAWLGWGDALLRQERPAEALEPLDRALELSRREGVPRTEAEAWRKIGVAHLELGDLAAAREALTTALEVGPREAQVEGATRSRLARLLAAEGRPEEALEELRQAMEIREETRATISLPQVRATYLSRWREDFSLLIDLLLRTGAPPVQALEASERAHARTLQELLMRRGGSAGGEAPAELLEARRQAEATESQLITRLISRPGAEEERRIYARLDRLSDELQDLEWRIQRARNGGDGETAPEEAAPASLQEIQARLADDEALLEYALGEERSVLFVVTRAGLTVHDDLPPADDIATALREMRRHLEKVQPHRMHLLPRAGHRLYDWLVAPAEAELAGVDSLLVVPDRELFYLPFEALVTDDPEAATDGQTRWLVDRWAVGYVPAATVLRQLLDDDARGVPGEDPPALPPGRSLVAFADSLGANPAAAAGGPPGAALASRRAVGEYGPLPAAGQEVRRIAELLPADASSLFIGGDATLGQIADPAVARADWLHFAVHGFFDDQQPDVSGLMLADGELRATEIRKLDLDAELVVLSACQTGLGREVWGEELIGLSRAFFAAGAPTVVVSLWQVADRSTEELMVELYRNLLAGQGPRAALTEAKRQLRRQGSHPYYWAPFIVIGRPDFASGRNARPEAPPGEP